MDEVVEDLRMRLERARDKVRNTTTLFGMGDSSIQADLYGLAQVETRINVLNTTSRNRVNAGSLPYTTWLGYAGEINRTIALHDQDSSQWQWSSALGDIGISAATDLRAGLKEVANMTPFVSVAILALVGLYFFGGRK